MTLHLYLNNAFKFGLIMRINKEMSILGNFEEDCGEQLEDINSTFLR